MISALPLAGLILSVLIGITGLVTAVAGPDLSSGTMPRSTAPRTLGNEDLTCSDFATWDEAQSALEADAADPHGLDVDRDGIACEAAIVAPGAGDVLTGTPRPLATPQSAPAPDPPATRAVSTDIPSDDVDCEDFASQEDAQAVYDRSVGDPHNLDPSGDGFACSLLPGREAPPIVPAG